ncbi:uncharacterized protein B0T23DRAFT_383160, partial [Neurospora hispaniola]
VLCRLCTSVFLSSTDLTLACVFLVTAWLRDAVFGLRSIAPASETKNSEPLLGLLKKRSPRQIVLCNSVLRSTPAVIFCMPRFASQIVMWLPLERMLIPLRGYLNVVIIICV